MSLVLGINLCQTSSCKIIRFSESTGSYSGSNPGGWGTGPYNPVTNPNPQTSDVDTVNLTIEDPSGTSVVFTYANCTPLANDFPDDTATKEIDFFNTNAGITWNSAPTLVFPDGFYTVTYFVAGQYGAAVDFDFTVKQAFLLTCQTRCCVDKLFHLASQDPACPDCKNTKLASALEAEAYLKSAEYAAACGKIEMAKQHLAKAQWICNTKNCYNC